jgi:hypothetical protein
MGRGEVLTGFWWGNMREGNHLEDPGVGGRIILKCYWTGHTSLRIWTNDELL